MPHDCHPRIVSDHDSRTLQAFIFGHQCFVSAAAAANRWSAQSSTSHATLTTATIICRSSSAAARSSGDSGDVDSSKESDSSRQARIHAVLDRRADNDCCSKDQRRKAQRDDERHTFILSSRASPGRALAIVSTAVGARCFRASPANPVRPGTHCASAGRAGKWPTAAARGRGQPAGLGAADLTAVVATCSSAAGRCRCTGCASTMGVRSVHRAGEGCRLSDSADWYQG